MNESVVACGNFDPVHADNLGVNHKPESIGDIAFEGRNDGAKQFSVGTLGSFEDAWGKVRWSYSGNMGCTYLELWVDFLHRL